jgi:hypothetical protein
MSRTANSVVTVNDINNLRFRPKEIPMSLRTWFIGTQSLHSKREFRAALVIALTLGSQLIAPHKSIAHVNGVGQRPYLGWSTYSEQTINSSFLTQARAPTLPRGRAIPATAFSSTRSSLCASMHPKFSVLTKHFGQSSKKHAPAAAFSDRPPWPVRGKTATCLQTL